MGDEQRPPRLPSVPGHGDLPQWHIQDQLEAIRDDLRKFRDQQVDHNRETEKQLIEHAHELKQHKDSLNAGNAKFAGLEAKIMPRWSTIVVVIGAAATVIWAASRYPDPQKFEDLKAEVQQMKLDNVNARRDVEELKKSSVRVEEKLDRVLSRP
jgi:hypothetical protein